jgi:hypothetical protein
MLLYSINYFLFLYFELTWIILTLLTMVVVFINTTLAHWKKTDNFLRIAILLIS